MNIKKYLFRTIPIIAALFITLSTSAFVEANEPPTVDAGQDQTLPWPTNFALFSDAAASDDGLPNPPGALSFQWLKIDGPGNVDFSGSETILNSSAVFSSPGDYTLMLLANDGQYGSSDTVKIHVLSAPPQNKAPVVDAGEDQKVFHFAQLTGVVSDDGLPTGQLYQAWTKISGPGIIVFQNPESLKTKATFSSSGTYVIELKASDGELTGSDQVIITVLPKIRPNAGSDRKYKLGDSASLEGKIDVEDVAGINLINLSINWSLISGPGPVEIIDPHSLVTLVQFKVSGEYVFRLSFYFNNIEFADEVKVEVIPGKNGALLVGTQNKFEPNKGQAGKIVYELTQPGHMFIRVYDRFGQTVKVLTDEQKNVGSQIQEWDGQDSNGRSVAAGVYHISMELDGQVIKKAKFVLIR